MDLLQFVLMLVTMIVGIVALVGIPALAIMVVRYLKLKERELTFRMQSGEGSQDRQVALEERVKHLEQTLASLDRDVRVKIGIERTDLLEGPDAPSQAERPPVRTR
ncbi:MAG: hypothetical protein ABR567_22800 [Myxococcales bacterium]|nr:hypothetical protein [Myxococcales bacterium]